MTNPEIDNLKCELETARRRIDELKTALRVAKIATRDILEATRRTPTVRNELIENVCRPLIASIDRALER